jgi:hypothetical protein
MEAVMRFLRPHPHRGDTVAAGVVVLTVFTVLVNLRFAADWSTGAHFVFSLAIALPVAAMAVLSKAGDVTPRPYESILYVADFILSLQALVFLADLLGIDSGSFNATWVGLVLISLCLFYALRRNSAIMTLLGALTAVFTLIVLIDWILEVNSFSDIEWILLISAVLLTLGAVSQRDARRRHAVSLVDAAGLTAFFLGLAVFFEQVVTSLLGAIGGRISGALDTGAIDAGQLDFSGVGTGWEIVLLAFGFGLVAYGCVDRERVPSFIGVLVLLLFILEAFFPGEDGPSLIGWPLILAVLGAALLAVGLRPRQDLPPEPPVPPPA